MLCIFIFRLNCCTKPHFDLFLPWTTGCRYNLRTRLNKSQREEKLNFTLPDGKEWLSAWKQLIRELHGQDRNEDEKKQKQKNTVVAVWKINSPSCHMNANPHSWCYRGAKHPKNTALNFWPSLCCLGVARAMLIIRQVEILFAPNNVKRGQRVFRPCRNLLQLLFVRGNYKAHANIIAVLRATFYYSNMYIDCIRPRLLQNCGSHGGSQRFTLHYGVSSVLPWWVCLSAAQ